MTELRLVDDNDIARHKPETFSAARAIVNSFEDPPPIDAEVMRTICRWIHRGDRYGIGDGRGHATATLRVFLESEVNRDALIEPIFTAVSSVMTRFDRHGLALLDALDRIKLTDLLATMRSLDLFSETSLPHYLSIAIQNKVLTILEPPVAKPAPTMAERKEARARKCHHNERNIELGRQMLQLRSEITSDREFSRHRRDNFRVDTKRAAELMAVASAFGLKSEVYCRLSWRALVELSSPTFPKAAREALEARIIAGGRIGAPEIRAARRPPAVGKGRSTGDRRMAAAA
jgi:hypothetical protein